VKLRLQPIRVAAVDGDGLLVSSDLGLVAVLVRLSELHGQQAGEFFRMTSNQPLNGPVHN
jgi:hypothetical protein